MQHIEEEEEEEEEEMYLTKHSTLQFLPTACRFERM